MILTIKLVIIAIIIKIMIKCGGRRGMPTPTNTELLVTLHNGQSLSVISKGAPPQML